MTTKKWTKRTWSTVRVKSGPAGLTPASFVRRRWNTTDRADPCPNIRPLNTEYRSVSFYFLNDIEYRASRESFCYNLMSDSDELVNELSWYIIRMKGNLLIVVSLWRVQESDVSAEARVCSACRCRVVRRRYVQCPLPTCPTSKRRVKRLRPLPNKWNELPTDIRTALENEFQVRFVDFITFRWIIIVFIIR